MRRWDTIWDMQQQSNSMFPCTHNAEGGFHYQKRFAGQSSSSTTFSSYYYCYSDKCPCRGGAFVAVLVCHGGSRHEVRISIAWISVGGCRTSHKPSIAGIWPRMRKTGLGMDWKGHNYLRAGAQGGRANLSVKFWCRRRMQDHPTIGRAPSWWDVFVVLNSMSRWKRCVCCMDLKLWEGPELVSFNLKMPLASSLWRRHGQRWVPRDRGGSPSSQGDPRTRDNRIESSILEYPPSPLSTELLGTDISSGWWARKWSRTRRSTQIIAIHDMPQIA